ncbi:Lysophospholipase L1-like esterase OS=Singulisphaera acidiphila (strain ATCC BAA-1392 / DSM 18658 / VKM B-2454 / MOB10) GN=Sinac_5740 PE=4 SV=1: DUF3472 [Tuwongella immobilis]|uniref:Uncharacterized protein n=2 Tax=Tuwongella immobilis TaxID=692036 RepID=A0A6C2YMG2_9BACT|nr:Lysophospholipase L1-like esterase OS=Singulisphaera acidiphila (strain ATCC BAA-1392 / DSM 18658 / VKM B-2454 / MOB10) GN=Sinac_5740 PE=4 SV=1: DUF3472 [Tuwongella immobilis]VTS01966.1 Lysophospholipase L1-like esterase OS=Singulisphaera acidiphila (strain ATCC BAA-1392 / DSM 18658 / VKM B-2454 / MOB10) GN=Sinac_5740 PE=4 SV=1: DUF3472 [Tuwongella immobilis]
MRRIAAVGLLAAMLVTAGVVADEKLKGIACRSIHFGYPGPESIAYYNEITVHQSAEGTYFMACGFTPGYFGIQELANGKKLVLFSVWDNHSGDDPTKVPEADRVKLLHKDPAVRVGRFGGEGTGGQSFFDYDWKVGATYRFLVSVAPDGDDRTAFTGWFYLPEKSEWKKLVTFSTKTNVKRLRGYNSFVEDFRRNRISATKTREATFGPAWVVQPDGSWKELTKARFTGDSNPVRNIRAEVVGNRFKQATGGKIEEGEWKLNGLRERAGTQPPKFPTELILPAAKTK